MIVFYDFNIFLMMVTWDDKSIGHQKDQTKLFKL